ncbi:MAG: hypothetical protein MRZ79_27065 [Bacteroidia bacterium]|nr:hypothetical protein [Bacteroidia bacterium]
MKGKVIIPIWLLLLSKLTFCQQPTENLLVFIGEKISVIEAERQNITTGTDTVYIKGDTTFGGRETHQVFMDSKFTAYYKIKKLLHGKYAFDTITFIAFDHYGKPAFSDYRHALLFVSSYPGDTIFYHKKYQFYDVYRSKNGRWAGSYSAYDYNNQIADRAYISPHKIKFEEKVIYPVNPQLKKEELQSLFPKPYFKIKRDQAIAIYGNYADELFQLWKCRNNWQ